jgi:type I restriction enzyme, S subunit
MNWKQTTLGEVAEIVSGATPKSDVPVYWDGAISWATPTDLSGLSCKHIDKTSRTISEAGLNACSARMLPPQSVLFSSRAPIGLVAINTTPMATNQGFKSFVPKPELNADFLFWWLKSNRKQLADLGNGATFKEVSKAVVSRVPFPLPPVDEQRRIAAILDKADDIRRKREKILAFADDLLKSMFLDMFGDPNTNTGRYPTAPVKQLGRVVTGNTPPREDTRNYGDFLEWIKSDNINTPDHYITEAVERLSETGARRARTVPAGATLVTCIAGSPDCIGNAALTDREVAFNQQINAVVPFEPTDAHFLYAQVAVAKPLIQRASTNSMKGMISKGRFEEIELLNPPFDLQRAFGKWFGKFLDLVARAKWALRESETQMASLSQRAFRGKL